VANARLKIVQYKPIPIGTNLNAAALFLDVNNLVKYAVLYSKDGGLTYHSYGSYTSQRKALKQTLILLEVPWKAFVVFRNRNDNSWWYGSTGFVAPT
jgi:hypothetical protein